MKEERGERESEREREGKYIKCKYCTSNKVNRHFACLPCEKKNTWK